MCCVVLCCVVLCAVCDDGAATAGQSRCGPRSPLSPPLLPPPPQLVRGSRDTDSNQPCSGLSGSLTTILIDHYKHGGAVETPATAWGETMLGSLHCTLLVGRWPVRGKQ